MVRKLLLFLLLSAALAAQVMTTDGEEAFVVAPSTEIHLRIRLLPSSLRGAVSATPVHFIASWRRATPLITSSDASGYAEAFLPVPSAVGYYSVDAMAAQGDADSFTFAVKVTNARPAQTPSAVAAQHR